MNVCPFVLFGIDQRQFLYVPNIILVKKLIVAVINFVTCTQNIAFKSIGRILTLLTCNYVCLQEANPKPCSQVKVKWQTM